MSSRALVSQLEKWMEKYQLPLMPVIWGTTCLVIGVLVGVGIYSYYSAEKTMAEQFNRQQLTLAKQAALGMEESLGNIRKMSVLLTRAPEAEGLRKRGTDQPEVLQRLFQKLGGGIDFIFWVNSRDILVSSYPPSRAGEMLGDGFDPGPHAKEARQKGGPVTAHINPPAGSAPAGQAPRFGSILVLAPVFRGPQFIGLLGCGVDFGKVYEKFVHPLRFGAQSGSWMINQEGTFIAHYDPALFGKDGFIARKERDPGFPREKINRIMREEMLAGKAGIDEYVTDWHLGERGKVRKLIAFAPVRLEDQTWSLAVVVPYSEVTRVVWGSFQSSAVLILVMALTLVAGTYLGHKINQERIRAEEKVKWGEEILRTQNRLQALFDGAPDAIAIVDRNSRIRMVNKTALNWYRKPAEDFVGKLCHQAFQGRSALCPNCPAEESLRTGEPAFRERASLVAGGNKYYLQIFTFPLRDSNGNVVEVVEYVKDVTAEKELQQQIIQSERLAVVGKMSANVAHEIKNPLGTIVLNAELLGEELDRLGAGQTAEARELLIVIKSELDRLIEVVEEYLQFARLPKVKLESGGLNEVFSDLLFFLREEASDRNILVVEEMDPSLPPVDLDPRALRQAFLNIIKNSFDAMPDGGKLTVSTARKAGKVEITISDTGKGIQEENQELIFTPFFSTKHGGTGLGLSITSHIVKEHRGTISFQSYPDLGTSFTIRLPLAPQAGSAGDGNVKQAWPVPA